MSNQPQTALPTGNYNTRLYRASLLLVALSAWLLITDSAAAEVLILTDGQVINTKGPWEVDGRRVTYTAENGTFSAVRLTMVDLEKSRAMTEALLNPVAPKKEPAPTPKVGLVVRQSDIRTVSNDALAESKEPAAEAVSEIAVASWSEELATVGTRLVGTVHNASESVYLSLRLEVTLVAENGDELATRAAKLERTWADPGTSLSFEADFPDVFAHSTANFSITGKPFLRRTPEAEDADTPEYAEDAAGSEQPTTQEPPRR